ncbi:GntR family transcriptional regulator/MocR family aminotransferase [Larkinella arboricola]|uniref:GntR family transcriptional regulator/MocR family aminotransferase n=1 Tax=Larkinella arboricola TaxID=643671 RepID=A0A327X1F0_LARAB|nr:PLP-dependent aminotransferase family protein [Larkinella arboricola]RAK00168.1 GntR family transcriptional regulator/MocR family aminotransferase [Larkinella arboricola]
MLPFKSLIVLDKSAEMAVFLQLAGQIRQLISEGLLPTGQKLPGTRQLAELLRLHRKTVIAAYDELLAEGWLEARAGSGTFVAGHLPVVLPKPIEKAADSQKGRGEPGFQFVRKPHLARPLLLMNDGLRLDDGFPDIRIAPMDELARAYRSYFRWGNPQQHFGYGDPKGNRLLREELSVFLNETRALRTTPDNILVVRGSIMGIHLASTLLLEPGQTAVVGETNWSGANMNFLQTGADLLTVAVDGHGLDVEALAELCRHRPVRLVYVTPHHHYPTTVTMPPDRRLRLLQLSQQYGFVILEDDYDYEFHYLRRPILPLASADPHNMVIYVGSLSKSVAPAFRIGYVVAPETVIDELARLRRIIDRQGDTMLEFAVGQLFRNGDLRRHLKKAHLTYEARCQHFCSLLKEELPDVVQFAKPEGGLAVWARFDRQFDLNQLAGKARREGLTFADGLAHNPPGQWLNSTRLGFASSTETELEQSVAVLRKLTRG